MTRTEQCGDGHHHIGRWARRSWTFPSHRTGRLSAVVTVVAVSFGLSACDGSSSPHLAATSGSSTATAGAAANSDPTGPGDIQSALLAFARCMRSNGVPTFPDPRGGGFQVSGLDRSSPAFNAAQVKCQKFLPAGPGSGPPPSAQALASMVKVSQCMRRHGILDFPDPQTSVPAHPFGGGAGKGGVISDIDGVILVFPGTLDTQSAAFTRAAAACAFPLHNH